MPGRRVLQVLNIFSRCAFSRRFPPRRARTAFGVHAYGVRCTCVQCSVYVRTSFGVRGHRNEIGMPFGIYAA